MLNRVSYIEKFRHEHDIEYLFPRNSHSFQSRSDFNDADQISCESTFDQENIVVDINKIENYLKRTPINEVEPKTNLLSQINILIILSVDSWNFKCLKTIS